MNKKYNLKPGRHQFAPGAPAEHTNDNLTDEEAEWYLKRYPHIAALFELVVQGKTPTQKPSADHSENVELENSPRESVESIQIGVAPKNKSVESIIIGETERSDLMSAAEKLTTGE